MFAAPDDPITVDETQALSLVVLGPSMPHAGRGIAKSAATEAVTDGLMRCRASQRGFRNTLLYVAADETLLGTAREAMRRSLAWASIADDRRLQEQLTQAQAADARDKAKTGREGAAKAVRLAWSHVLFPVKTEGTVAGTAFDLDHLSISSKDRTTIPAAVYEKAKGDGIAREKLGPDALWLHLKPLWAEDKPHLPISEVADWFAAYVYLPKLRDRVVLETTIRDAVAKLDPAFGYADGYDEATARYTGLVIAKSPPIMFAPTAVLVRAEVAFEHTKTTGGDRIVGKDEGVVTGPGIVAEPAMPQQPRRFYGSVEIDMVRPVKAFDAILNAVVLELQRNPDAKVKITLEIEAETASGFSETDIGVVRDNARQLRFKPESTGFE